MASEDKSEEVIFNAVIQLRSRVEREAYLDESCGDNREVRANVEALLLAHDEGKSLIDTPIFDLGPSAP